MASVRGLLNIQSLNESTQENSLSVRIAAPRLMWQCSMGKLVVNVFVVDPKAEGDALHPWRCISNVQ